VRAADGAAPRGDRRGENSEKSSLSVVVGRRRPAADAIVRLVVEMEKAAAVGQGKRRPPAGRQDFRNTPASGRGRA